MTANHTKPWHDVMHTIRGGTNIILRTIGSESSKIDEGGRTGTELGIGMVGEKGG